MDIKVLGTGCPKCKLLEKNTQEAVKELGVDANVEKISEIKKILEYDILLTPALVIDGKVKSSGKVLTKAQIKKLIAEAQKQ